MRSSVVRAQYAYTSQVLQFVAESPYFVNGGNGEMLEDFMDSVATFWVYVLFWGVLVVAPVAGIGYLLYWAFS